MKLSSIKGEDAIEVVARILEPIARIASDSQIRKDREAKKPVLLIIKYALENYKSDVLEILAALNMTSVDEYVANVNLVTLPLHIMEIMNDPEVQAVFESQSQTEKTSSGSVTESTEANEN